MKRWLITLASLTLALATASACTNTTPTHTPAPTLTPTTAITHWLADLIYSLENAPVANPPASITRYEYKGQTVYFLPERCSVDFSIFQCGDIYSDLYDAEGNIIGHPRGITFSDLYDPDSSSERVPGFFEERTGGEVIWQDERWYDPNLGQVSARIQSVDIVVLETFPPQYRVIVTSALYISCRTFGGYTMTRDDSTIRIDIVHLGPMGDCFQSSETIEHSIHLGSDFISGVTYTVVVNDVTETFVAQ